MGDLKKEWEEHIRAIEKNISLDVLTGEKLSKWMEPLVQSVTSDGAVPYLIDTNERYRASPLASTISWLEKANLVPRTVLTGMQQKLLFLRDENMQNDPYPGNNEKRDEDMVGWSLGEGVSVWSTSCAIIALLDSQGNGISNALNFKSSVLWLANQRNSNRGWAYQRSTNCEPNVPMTALALRSLALAYTESNKTKFNFSPEEKLSLEEAIQDGYEYIKSNCVTTRNKSYWCFQNTPHCAATTWALLALDQVKSTDAKIASDCSAFYEKIKKQALFFVCSKIPKKDVKWPEELFVHEGGAKYGKQKNYSSFSATLLPQLFELGVSPFHPSVINQIKWLIEHPEDWKITSYDKGKVCYFTYAMVISTIVSWLQRVGIALAPKLTMSSHDRITHFFFGYNSTRNIHVQLVQPRRITVMSSVILLLLIILFGGKHINALASRLSTYILSFLKETKNERYDVIVGVISNFLEAGIMAFCLAVYAFIKRVWRRFIND